MKYLVTGAAGMLGSTFIETLGADAIPIGRASLNVREPGQIADLVARHRPDVLINCAAHVDAEAAETDPDSAFLANSILPELLAAICRRTGVRIVHFSSTGCYGDWKADRSPYSEEDPVRPTTLHHASKVSGESAIRTAAPEHLILRTGWLFGGLPEHKKNFVWKRICEAASSRQMRSDADQKGNPTFVRDVIDQTLLLIDQGVTGTYNCVGQGVATRLDYVSAIVRLAGIDCLVEPSGAFKRIAPVSSNESAINYRLGLRGLDRMPRWETSLARYLDEVRTFPAWQAITEASRAR